MAQSNIYKTPASPDEQGISAISPKRLTDTLIKVITERLDAGVYRAGSKLPSEAALCTEFQVSRTVVREAVASMRQGGRLVSKPGIGVFVVEETVSNVDFTPGPGGDIRWGLHIMELRMAIEVEAAGLAAERRTPQDLADIAQAYDRFASAGADHAAIIASDIEFHFAISRASHNPHFSKILESSVNEVTADLAFKHGVRTEQEDVRCAKALMDYEKRIAREHGAIMSAISRRDIAGARTAMTRHLADSIARYRLLLSKVG